MRFHFAVGTLVHTLRMSDEADLLEQMKVISNVGMESKGAKSAETARSGRSRAKRRSPAGGGPSTELLVDEIVNFVTAGMET